MKNEPSFVQEVKKKLNPKDFQGNFMVSHFFTQYKIHSADYFISKLENIEKAEASGIVGEKRDESRIYIDCACYEMGSIYDGIFNEINSAFKLNCKHRIGFRKNVHDVMAKKGSKTMIKIDKEYNTWIKDFKQERNDYTHVKIRGVHIKYELGKPIEVYDRYDMVKPNKKTLVKKLRDYFKKMVTFVDDVYLELAKEL